MHGNVWEWCLDWSGDLPSISSDPLGPSSGSERVRRGGSWDNNADSCNSSYRDDSSPTDVFVGFGFRLVRTLEK